MKKLLLMFSLLCAFILCSCSNNRIGFVDCYSIQVTSGGQSVYDRQYTLSYVSVYEYKNEKGDEIYSNYIKKSSLISDEYEPIKVYNSRYDVESTEYKYEKFVGWMTVESSYYLDLDNRVIDAKTRFYEYCFKQMPSDAESNNKKAFECAKKGFYYTEYFGLSYAVVKEFTESSLERHEYTKLGSDSLIKYTVKWF